MSNCVNFGMYFTLPPACVDALLMSISFIFLIAYIFIKPTYWHSGFTFFKDLYIYLVIIG